MPALNSLYEVEEILKHKIIDNKNYYLIKWKNYKNVYNTWEPESNLLNCEKLLNKFKSDNLTPKLSQNYDIQIKGSTNFNILLTDNRLSDSDSLLTDIDKKTIEYYLINYKDKLVIRDHLFHNNNIYFVVYYTDDDYILILKKDLPLELQYKLLNYYENTLKIRPIL